jgi:Zn-dependent peptidase ImmA (M78 family)
LRNVELKPRTRHDIDQQVAKLLSGIGNPEPPLQLSDVRDALKLDLQFYSSTQTSVLSETVHRFRVGLHQVARRPFLLIDVVKKLSLKALWVPDRKRILIDADEPELKHRWNEAHEVGHSIIPWHEAVLHGDNHRTLKPACHHAIEAEANYAAGRTLFLQDRFTRELPLDLAVVKALHKAFGNTLTSTLWRAVEHFDGPALGVVSSHPHYPPDDFDFNSPCKYFIRSPAFAAQFSNVTELAVFSAMQNYCTWKKTGPLGESEMVVTDDIGQSHVFFFESFCNRYETLTLAVYRHKHSMVVAL